MASLNSRWVAALLALAVYVIFFAAAASLDTVLFGQAFPYLLGFALTASAGLLVLVLRQFVLLWRQYRSGRYGTRLRLKLSAMLIAMAVLPAMVLYGVSAFFVVRAIDTWFDVRVDRALESAVTLTRHAADTMAARLIAEGKYLRERGWRDELPLPELLARQKDQFGVDAIVAISGSGQVLAFASDEDWWLSKEPVSAAELQVARSQGQSHRFGEDMKGAWVRAIVWAERMGGEERYFVLIRRVPSTISESMEAIQRARADYLAIVQGQEALQRLYLVVLAVAVLGALLAATILALFFARRFVAPLIALEEGTRAVAEGDFRPLARQVRSNDELASVLRSFDVMTQRLQEAQAEQRRSHAEVESARRYLETVLQHLSAGVLVFDAQRRLLRCNEAAIELLGGFLRDALGLTPNTWAQQAALGEQLGQLMQTAAGPSTFECKIEGSGRTLLVHVAPIAGALGWVVVLDDITDVIQGQRMAAWGEIARRLAHEIKNPLTPIRLAAERLRYKLEPVLAEKERQLLQRATQTIVDQVAAMSEMVNAFRDYARLPAPQRERLELEALVRAVLLMYESGSVPIELHTDGAGPYWIHADAAQLRQVLHNLLQNAQDALTGIAAPRIDVRLERKGAGIILTIADNGIGFPEGFQAHAFEPYYTTKSKGTGLGLAVVKKILDEHGARIQLRQRPERGAEVVIEFRAEENG